MKRSQLKTYSPLKRTSFKRKGYSWGMKRSRLRVKSDKRLAAWSKKVRERDGNVCQWPGVSVLKAPYGMSPQFAASPCATGDTRIDPHHLAKRSQRRDLKYELSNGLLLCRTHHDWTDDNHDAAVAMGLLNTESRELAQKNLLAA